MAREPFDQAFTQTRPKHIAAPRDETTPAARFSHNPLAQLAAAFAAGIVFATYISFTNRYFFFALAVTTIGTLLVTYLRRWVLAGPLLLICFFLAGCILTVAQKRKPDNQLKDVLARQAFDNASVEVTGVVVGSLELGRDVIHFTLEAYELKSSSVTLNCKGLIAFHSWFKNKSDELSFRQTNLQSGSQVTIRTKLDRAEQYRNPGVSTLNDYLETKDLDAIAVLRGSTSILHVRTPEDFSVTRLLYRWRGVLQQQIDEHFSAETASVLAAALLGNRYNLSYAAAERFREGGTFHILVISGAHITFIGTVVLLIVRRLVSRRWLRLTVATSVVWLYTVGVGADVSVVRAALMFAFVTTGHLLFRRSSSLNSLGAALLILLVWNPKDLFDPSLQLTFLSVLAIVAFALPILRCLDQIGAWRPLCHTPRPPQCSRWLQVLSESLFWSESKWRSEQAKLNHGYRLFKTPAARWLEEHHLQPFIRYLFAGMVVTISVQVMLLPLQIIYFHRLSFSSLILNIVVGILLAALAAVALLAVVCAQLATSLAMPLIGLANSIEWLMEHSVDPFVRLGIASWRIPDYSGRWWIIYLVYFLPLLAFAVFLQRWNPVRDQRRKIGRVRGSQLVPLSIAQALLFALLVVHPYSAQATQGQLRVDFLDVGQGDSILLTMPDGATLLVDGGGKPQFFNDSASSRRRRIGETVVSEYLWHRSLDAVDYVLATHADADHMEGLNDVVKNFNVRGALVARKPQNNSAFVEFAKTLVAQTTPVQVIQSGDVLKFGAVEIDVLWPPAISDVTGESGNNDSVVLRIKYGERTFLLTGDIEKAAESLLSRRELLRADVLKVPHHGSRSSSTELFVSAVRPNVAVISVGRKSMFGHPHEEVVQRWQAAGAEVLTTGRSGMITVMTDGKSLNVRKFIQD